MSKYKKGEYSLKLLAGIHVAKSFINLFPDQLRYFLAVIITCSLFPSFYDKIRT